ncbi:hypothetical protein [Heyndrickxia camelliae]|uniref:Uncharacterized protein n=1 Tax=Heyndrickxia camelliae TaxID=1707093 RepID=A0A2N3LFU5_9BACI|nr:hypothetical protein [Heyndrickxia camelliae]PKR83522.1 hypothetical protein CWO92_18325 [Heyndrickxia camelliae]
MAVAKRGSAVKKGLKFFVFGEAGTWKSSFSLDFMKMKNEDGRPLRVLYIDCETGSVDNYLEDLEDQGIDLNNLLLVYTTTYAEVEEWATKAMNEEELMIENEDGDLEVVLDADGNPFVADVIIVDGITVISDNVKFAAINVSEKRAKLKAKSQEKTATEQFVAEATAGLEFKDHDKIKMKGKNLLRSLITGTDKYVVVTSREKTKKVMSNVDGKMQLVEVGKIPDTWDGAEYEFYTVLRHFEDEDGTIKAQIMRKDRTKVFQQNEIIDEPTPLYWQEVITKNKGKASNVLKDRYEDSISKDEEVIAKGITKNQDTTPIEVNTEPQTVEDYRKEIQKAIDSLSPSKKKALRPKLSKAGLDLDFNAIEKIEDLKKFLSLATE